MTTYTFEIIGHRGCEGLAPENSMAAMNKAIELGIDRVEFDINETKDGDLIVIHDKNVRVGVKHVPVSQLDRVAIVRAKGVPLDEVPLLDEVLAACKGRIKIQAELKPGGIEARVLAAFNSSSFPVTDVSISSFDLDRLARVHELAPSLAPAQLVYLLDRGKDVVVATADMLRIGIGSLSVHASCVTPELVTFIHEHAMRALVWGVGERGKPRRDIIGLYELLLGKGVDGFTCAYPDMLMEMVRVARSTR